MLKNMLLLFIMACMFSLHACTATTPLPAPTPSGPQTLRVMTHDSFAISEEVIKAFESQHNAVVQILPSGDAGTALNKAILSKGNPIADVFYGLDNTFLSRALSEGIFETYHAPLLADIPDSFKLDGQDRALPVDYGDVCPNYDIAYFEEKGLQPPASLDDLLKPEYKGLLVVENPATSSPGLAFLLATIGHYGEAGYLSYWKDLAANEVLVVNDWNSAYYSEFSAHDGTRPLVISYSSSPPAEVIYAETPIDKAPTAAMTGPGVCFRQIEFAGILKGSQNIPLAQQWIDFMLSPQFQEDMPLQMFVYPVNSNAALPEEFTLHVTLPTETISVDPQAIAKNREKWIQAWTEAVLR
jgi:thiamine transport system substrate-binding protein